MSVITNEMKNKLLENAMMGTSMPMPMVIDPAKLYGNKSLNIISGGGGAGGGGMSTSYPRKIWQNVDDTPHVPNILTEIQIAEALLAGDVNMEFVADNDTNPVEVKDRVSYGWYNGKMVKLTGTGLLKRLKEEQEAYEQAEQQSAMQMAKISQSLELEVKKMAANTEKLTREIAGVNYQFTGYSKSIRDRLVDQAKKFKW